MPSHAKPAHGWELFPDFRWRKYFSRIDWPVQGARIVGYYCRQWEARYPDIPLQSVEIFSYRQLTEPHAKPEGKGVFKGTCRARNR